MEYEHGMQDPIFDDDDEGFEFIDYLSDIADRLDYYEGLEEERRLADE